MNILCGYNVNIDSVYRISGAEVSELLRSFERTEILNKIENPPEKIIYESDFAAGLVHCMKNGSGAEWLVSGEAVFEFLKARYFHKSLVRMGGNAGIMANVLSEIGASRVVPNVAVPSKTQLSLFSKKAVYFPDSTPSIVQNSGKRAEKIEKYAEKNTGEDTEEISEENTEGKRGENIEEKPGKEPGNEISASFSNQDPIHFVFDFSKDETFSLYGAKIRVPRENRFIATCDHLNFRLFTSPAFEDYALKHAGEMDGALISGFHLLLETYPDGSTYKEVLERSSSQLKAWKAENEKLRIHVEFGHFATREIADSVFFKFARISDSIGMNEDELAMFHSMHGVPVGGLSSMEAEAIGEAACKLASIYGLGKLSIHTREFILVVFKMSSGNSEEPEVSGKQEDKGSPSLLKAAEKNLEAMDFGLRCAGAYAASGRLGGREFIEKESLKLQESGFGREQLQLFLKAFNGETCGRGAFALIGGYMLCILPTLLCRYPITTVGLGDTLTAGTFLRGLELDVQT